MNTGLRVFAATLLIAAAAHAQGGPSGRGAVTGDPAASSSTPHGAPTTGAASRSGSGTSTSGGKDDNGDQGRDKMPESDHTVRPDSQQHHPNDK